MPKRIDLTGQKFSHLTVLKFDEEKTKTSGRTHWFVECDCDDHTIFSVSSSNLKCGNSTKCKYCKAENLLGQRFERLTVTKRIIDDKDHVMWEATCDCGNKIIVRGDSLRTGHTRSCGCLQKEVVGSINKKTQWVKNLVVLLLSNKANEKIVAEITIGFVIVNVELQIKR